MAIYSYNGYRPSLGERIRGFFPFSFGSGFSRKAAPAPVAMEMRLPEATWMSQSARTYFQEGYLLNSAVYACTRALANAFAEAPLVVYTDETRKKQLPKHPFRQVIRRPNELMGEDEFWKRWIVYSANGGNSYGLLVPSPAGLPGEIWPYSDVFMSAIPTKDNPIDHYNYSPDGVNFLRYEIERMVHYQWDPHPFKQWTGIPALQPVAREVDSDNELVRYMKALLQNDAVVRGLLTLPAGVAMNPTQRDRAKAEWKEKFSGTNRGDIAILENGMTYQRLALNLQELAFEALHAVGEARIAASYGPGLAQMVGLNVGMAHNTYSNYEEAHRAFTELGVMPKWEAVASTFQQRIMPFYGNDGVLGFDLSRVRALAQSNESVFRIALDAWKGGLYKRNEARAKLGDEAVPPEEDTYYSPSLAPVVTDTGNSSDSSSSSNNVAAAASNGGKEGAPETETKARKLTRQGVQRAIAQATEKYISDQYEAIASKVEGRRKAAIEDVLAIVDGWNWAKSRQQIVDMMRAFHEQLFAVAYDQAGNELPAAVDFNLADPNISKAIDRLAKRDEIKGISDTTRDDIRSLIMRALGQTGEDEEGPSVQEIAKQIRDLGEITSKSRSLRIARTETGTAMNVGATYAYEDAQVKEVDVFDGDDDEPCKSVNGTRQTLEWARANPLGHPNCTRGLAPVID